MLPVVVTIAIGVAALFLLLKKKNIHIWIGGYLDFLRRRVGSRDSRPMRVYFCIADHFEPFWNGVDRKTAVKRVEKWRRYYPSIASRHGDASGRPPQHTFFFPIEEYDPELIEMILDVCRAGYGDFEIHLHHDHDKGNLLREKIQEYLSMMEKRHNAFRRDSETGKIVYGFVHGNWALDNSRKDGRFCGVNDELTVLRETGCYADFTLPSAPSDTQTRKVNSIYFAADDPLSPKSHDQGKDVRMGNWSVNDLLIIQGPLCFNTKKRKFGIFPRIENGEITKDNPATPERVDLWVRNSPRIIGQDDAVFVKVHTHGAQDDNSETLLQGNLDLIWNHLEKFYNDGNRFVLHYATTFEIYQEVRKRACMVENTV